MCQRVETCGWVFVKFELSIVTLLGLRFKLVTLGPGRRLCVRESKIRVKKSK